MKEIWDCLFTHYGLAYATGFVIFIITLILVSKRVIGFAVTLILLIFALLASLAVAHSDSIKTYFNKLEERSSTMHKESPQETQNKAPSETEASSSEQKESPSSPKSEDQKTLSQQSRTDKILTELKNVYEDLKTFFGEQIEKVQH